MDDSDDVDAFIDREKHAINVRATPEIEDANRLIWVETLGRYRAPLGIQVQRENRFLETIEPCGALGWGAVDDPQIQLFD